MSWGDVPAWAALALSAGAGWVALLARRDSRQSAEASVRSAQAAEASLALQQQEAEERRQAALPRVHRVMEHEGGTAWTLRNIGSATAENVTVEAPGGGQPLVNAPRGVTLVPGAGHMLHVLDEYDQAQDVTHIMVTWDGQDAPVAVPLR
jgi:hypothetical protein